MSTRTLLTIAAISTVAFTGCKSVYSSVYSNQKNSFKPPIVASKVELKATDLINALTAPQPGGGLPGMGTDQNAIPGITPAPGADPAAPVPGAAPAIPGL